MDTAVVNSAIKLSNCYARQDNALSNPIRTFQFMIEYNLYELPLVLAPDTTRTVVSVLVVSGAKASMGRLYGRLIKKRIEDQYREMEDQSGFRAGRSCIDNIFVLQQIIEKRTSRNLPTHIVFIDLEKAYDTVPLKTLFETLTKADLSKIYIEAIMNMYRNAKGAIKMRNTISDPFPVTKGLRQGYDQVIIANDEEDMDYMIRKLTAEYEEWGLTINLNKTEYLKIKDEEKDDQLSITKIKKCDEFKYLGSVITKEGTSQRDIRNKVQQGRKITQTLNSLLWSP
ncbi:uncharacterized protein LOC135141885 [Zophobas morio]|uniref:uncharacterized protein LOC135141885 n=1 Tax=Zophobas morio TaxID=2755281 RepID=UPI0030838725